MFNLMLPFKTVYSSSIYLMDINDYQMARGTW